MTDWLETITDPTLKRTAILERESRRLQRRADNHAAYIRLQWIIIAVMWLTMWWIALH